MRRWYAKKRKSQIREIVWKTGKGTLLNRWKVKPSFSWSSLPVRSESCERMRKRMRMEEGNCKGRRRWSLGESLLCWRFEFVVWMMIAVACWFTHSQDSNSEKLISTATSTWQDVIGKGSEVAGCHVRCRVELGSCETSSVGSVRADTFSLWFLNILLPWSPPSFKLFSTIPFLFWYYSTPYSLYGKNLN